MNDPVPAMPLSPPAEADLREFPLILVLDQHGVPERWISWQQACFYYAKEQVAWDAGSNDVVVHGGISRLTGRQSIITANSIIAIRGQAHGHEIWRHTPPLSNRELFHRDRHMCAYCGRGLSSQRLTRDHVIPLSKGGRDNWTNVVAACKLSPPRHLPVRQLSPGNGRSFDTPRKPTTGNRNQFDLPVLGVQQ